MTSRSVILFGVATFVYETVLIWVFTDPGNGWNATNMTIGTKADSEVLILTPNSMSTLSLHSTAPLINNISDLRGMTPVDFLNFLRESETTDECIFRAPIKNWILKKDLPGLLSLIDSQEPCASVALMNSSSWNTQGSTVGQEALFMIEGYRKGEYPPALNSGGYSEADKKELVEWCGSQIDAAK
jgi:hypothetical protein